MLSLFPNRNLLTIIRLDAVIRFSLWQVSASRMEAIFISGVIYPVS